MKRFISKIQQRDLLTREEARQCFEQLFESEVPEEEIVEFLTLHSNRQTNAAELLGFTDYLSSQSNACRLDSDVIFDVCGTGGDGKNTINISTLTAIVLAAMGEKVAKHGNYSASSTVGSSNLLEALCVPFVDNEQKAQEIFSKVGIIFLHAPLWHPKLKKVGAIRKKLGFRTVFNLIGPLLNPANPRYQLIGAPTEITSRLLRDVQSVRIQDTSRQFAIISDMAGYDEASLTGQLYRLSDSADRIVSPSDFGVQQISASSIELPATIEETVSVSKRLLTGLGQLEHEYVVAANAALALQIRYPEIVLADLFKKALDTVRSGKCIQVLNSLRSFQ